MRPHEVRFFVILKVYLVLIRVYMFYFLAAVASKMFYIIKIIYKVSNPNCVPFIIFICNQTCV